MVNRCCLHRLHEWVIWQLLTALPPHVRSFIHSGYSYSAPSRNLLRGALSPATVKEKCLKKLAERRHVVLRYTKRSVRGSSFQVEEPITEKALRCLSAERARGGPDEGPSSRGLYGP